jgi:hypothetical protein
MALPVPSSLSEALAGAMSAPRVRRCTFRRLVALEVEGEQVYDVTCLYPDRRRPVPLGQLGTAAEICNACAAAHIFRPDED